MSTDAVFTGADFWLASVDAIAAATARVRFTQDPLAASDSGPNDGLNPSQYSLSGPGVNYVEEVSTVDDDPQSLDLTLHAPLLEGTWTLTISSNLQTASGRPLQPPQAMSFVVDFEASTSTIDGGAQNDSAESLLRKHLSPAFSGNAWNALIAALATGDRYAWDLAASAFDQLFKSSASGVYLDRLCGDDGLPRPRNLGLSDDLYRQLGIRTTTQKLTQESLLEALEVFYGRDSVRAYVETELSAPFRLEDLQTLYFIIDRQAVTPILFQAADFSRIAQARAQEVASVITRKLSYVDSKAFAVAVTDPETGDEKVRVYSGSLGLSSSIRVVGGLAQKGLRLETVISGGDTAAPWAVSLPEAGLVRMKMVGNGLDLDLTQVRVGDYLLVTGSNFDAGNRGSFEITAVDVRDVGGTLEQYLEFENSAGTVQASVAQVETDDVLFFRPTEKTIYATTNRTLVVSQTVAGELDISIPATSTAVTRGPGTAAYLADTDPIEILSMTRVGDLVTVETAEPHGLDAGSQVLVEDVEIDPGAPVVYLGDGVSTTDASPVSICASIAGGPHDALDSTLLSRDGSIWLIGGHYGEPPSRTTLGSVYSFSASELVAYPDGAVSYDYLWSLESSLNTARSGHAAAILEGLYPLVCGGVDSSVSLVGDGERLLGTWTATGAMNTARTDHQAVALDDGRVIAIGGTDLLVDLESTETCDGVLAWNVGPSMVYARRNFAALKLDDGRVLACGGSTSYTGATTEILTADGLSWATTGPMTYARKYHRALKLADGKVLVTGGFGRVATSSSSPDWLREAEIYDPGTGRWSPAGRMAFARQGHACVQLTDDLVMVAGGVQGAQGQGSIEYFNVNTRTWTRAPITMNEHQEQVLGLTVFDGVALLVSSDGTDSGSVDDQNLVVHGSDVRGAGGLAGVWALESASGTTMTYRTPDTSGYTGCEAAVLRSMAAEAGAQGPYLLDPQGGLPVTGIITTLAQEVSTGLQYESLSVADATSFPDEPGWLVLGFGASFSSGAIRYLGRIDDTTLRLDFRHRMTTDISAGAEVALLQGLEALETADNSFYLTASASGLVAAQAQVRGMVAAGVQVNLDVVYPGDRGLGNEGQPEDSQPRLSDVVSVFGGDDLDTEMAELRGED